MAKLSGLGMALSIDDDAGSPVAFSDFADDVAFTDSFGEQDVTPLSAFAMDRLQLTQDSKLSIKGSGFPDDTIMDCLTADPRLPVDGRDVVVTYPNGWSYTTKMMIFGVNISRPQNAGMSWSLEMSLTGGTPGVWAN